MDSAQIDQQLEKILPEDLARTFESAYHVFQGKHEHMDDLLKYGGVLLRKAAHKFSPTQLVVGIAALAAVAVVLINRTNEDDHEGEAHDMSSRRLSPTNGDKPAKGDKAVNGDKNKDDK